MNTFLATLLALSLLGLGCAGEVVSDPDSPPEGTLSQTAPTCELSSGDFGGYVECVAEDGSDSITVDNGEHACGGCAVGAACTAIYTGAKGFCR